MYHSVTFGDKNSWDDWHLISKDRPYIAQPTPKTKYVELSGASGRIDLTEALTGLPTYNDRTGSLTFVIDYEYWDNWYDAYNEISNYLNGYRYKLMLEDEPYCYYIGRFSVNSYAPGNSANNCWPTITIGYTLQPYKYKLEDVLVATLIKNNKISDYPSAVESDVIVTENMLFEVAPTFYLYGIDGDFGITIRDSESATQVDGKGIIKIEDYYCMVDYQVRDNSISMPDGVDSWKYYIPEDKEFANRLPTETYYGKCNLWYFSIVTYEDGEKVYTPKVVVATIGKSGLDNKVNLLDINTYFAASEYTTGVTADGDIPPKAKYTSNYSTVRTFVNSCTQTAHDQYNNGYNLEEIVPDCANGSGTAYSMGFRPNQTNIHISSSDYNSLNNGCYYSTGADHLYIFTYVKDSNNVETCYETFVETLTEKQKMLITVNGSGDISTSTKGPVRYVDVTTKLFSSSASLEEVSNVLSVATSDDEAAQLISERLDGVLTDDINDNVNALLTSFGKYLYCITTVYLSFDDMTASSETQHHLLYNVASIQQLGENTYAGIDEEVPSSDVVDWKASTYTLVHEGGPSVDDLPMLFDDRSVYVDSTMYGSYNRKNEGHDDNMWVNKTIAYDEQTYDETDGSYDSEIKFSKSEPFILASYKPGSVEITKDFVDGNPLQTKSKIVGELHTSFATIDDYHTNTRIEVSYLSSFRDYSVLKTSQTKKLENQWHTSASQNPLYDQQFSSYGRWAWNQSIGETAIKEITVHFLASSSQSVSKSTQGWSDIWDPNLMQIDQETPYLWAYETIVYANEVYDETDPRIIATAKEKTVVVDTDQNGNNVTGTAYVGISAIARAYAFSDTYIDTNTESDQLLNLSWQYNTYKPEGQGMYLYMRFYVQYTAYNPYTYIRFIVHYNANDSKDKEIVYFKPPASVYFDDMYRYAITGSKVFYLKTDKKDGITRDTKGWTQKVKQVALPSPYLWSYQELYLANGKTVYTTPRILATVRDNRKLADDAVTAKKLIWYDSMNQVTTSAQEDNHIYGQMFSSGKYNAQFYIRYQIKYYSKELEVEHDDLNKYKYTYFKIRSTAIVNSPVVSVQHRFLSSTKSSGIKRGDKGWTSDWHSVSPNPADKPYLWAYQILTLEDGTKVRTSPKVIAKAEDITQRGQNHFVNTEPGKLLSKDYTFDDDYSTGPIKLKGNRHVIIYGCRKNQSVPNRTGQLRMKYWKEVL